MTDIHVVVGAQFGSEGKGAISAYLTRDFNDRDVAIRVAGPNAGHTAYDADGREWKLRTVPVAAVTSPDCQLHIAAGSEIDPSVLASEVATLEEAGHKVKGRLTVHPSATMIAPHHQAREAAAGLIARVGSTGKGIGAARAERIMRASPVAGELYSTDWLSEPGPFDLDGVGEVLIEGTQGYGLGLHTGFYPQTTSSDCRAIDFLAMAGISPWAPMVNLNVILVARVFPIRVAGNSGPLKGETTWAELDLPEERTTVTNNVRRVGEWDQDLVLEAIRANGGGDWHRGVTLALTMVDQLFPEVRDKTRLSERANAHLSELETSLETEITYIGTGPQTVIEL